MNSISGRKSDLLRREVRFDKSNARIFTPIKCLRFQHGLNRVKYMHLFLCVFQGYVRTAALEDLVAAAREQMHSDGAGGGGGGGRGHHTRQKAGKRFRSTLRCPYGGPGPCTLCGRHRQAKGYRNPYDVGRLHALGYIVSDAQLTRKTEWALEVGTEIGCGREMWNCEVEVKVWKKGARHREGKWEYEVGSGNGKGRWKREIELVSEVRRASGGGKWKCEMYAGVHVERGSGKRSRKRKRKFQRGCSTSCLGCLFRHFFISPLI